MRGTLFIACLLVAMPWSVGAAQPAQAGLVVTDTVDTQGEDMEVVGPVVLADGGHLIINASTLSIYTTPFQQGLVVVQDGGTLELRGQPGKPAVLRENDVDGLEDEFFDWDYAIRIEAGGTLLGRHCEIEGPSWYQFLDVAVPSNGIRVKGTFSIQDCEVKDLMGGMLANDADVRIVHTTWDDGGGGTMLEATGGSIWVDGLVAQGQINVKASNDVSFHNLTLKEPTTYNGGALPRLYFVDVEGGDQPLVDGFEVTGGGCMRIDNTRGEISRIFVRNCGQHLILIDSAIWGTQWNMIGSSLSTAEVHLLDSSLVLERGYLDLTFGVLRAVEGKNSVTSTEFIAMVTADDGASIEFQYWVRPTIHLIGNGTCPQEITIRVSPKEMDVTSPITGDAITADVASCIAQPRFHSDTIVEANTRTESTFADVWYVDGYDDQVFRMFQDDVIINTTRAAPSQDASPPDESTSFAPSVMLLGVVVALSVRRHRD